MRAEDETPAERPLEPLDPLDRLRHDLRSPLTAIRGRAYLLARAVQRAPSLTEDERTRMLAGVAAIETAVTIMVTVIEGIDGDHATGAVGDGIVKSVTPRRSCPGSRAASPPDPATSPQSGGSHSGRHGPAVGEARQVRRRVWLARSVLYGRKRLCGPPRDG